MTVGIYIGSFLFIIAGIGTGLWLTKIVTKETKNVSNLKDNLILTYVNTAVGTVCFWLLWFCMYMH